MADTQTVRIAYDPDDLDRIGTIVELPRDEAKTLIRTGRASADLEPPAEHIPASATKATLLEVAGDRGVDVDANATKAEILEALHAAGVQ